MATSLVFEVEHLWTNDTFATNLCDALNSSLTALEIKPTDQTAPLFWLLPECIAQNATSLTLIKATRVVLSSFAHLPATLDTIDLKSTVFSAHLSSTPMGFNADGTVDWNEVFDTFPDISNLVLQGNLRGQLPPTLPGRLISFAVSENLLNGGIPLNLFTAIGASSTPIAALLFAANHNQLTGTLPATLLLPLQGRLIDSTFQLDFGSNALSGPLPLNFLSPLMNSRLRAFNLNLNNNNFTGTLEESLFPNQLISSTAPSANFHFDISFNRLSGRLHNLFRNFPPLTSFVFNIGSNQFSGPLPLCVLPNGFLGTNVPFYHALFFNNSFNGTIPANLFSGSLNRNISLQLFELRLDHNHLTGTIPNNLIHTTIDIQAREESLSVDKMLTSTSVNNAGSSSFGSRYKRAITVYAIETINYFALNLASNRLSGSITSDLFRTTTSLPTSFVLDVSNNTLDGSIPNPLIPQSSNSAAVVHLNFSKNGFVGSVPSACPTSTSYQLYVHQNKLTGSLSSNLSCNSTLFLDVSANSNLTGAIPESLFSSPLLRLLNASHTNILGNLTSQAPNSVSLIDLSHTDIAFCSASSISSMALIRPGGCILSATEACKCSSYFSACQMECPDCSPNTRPSIDFTCINGIWTAPNIVVPTITVPSGAGTIVIGNTSSTSIIFNGLGSTVTVEGCATNLTSIVVTLDKDDIEKLEKEGGGGGGKGGKSKPSFQRLLVLLGRSSSGGEVNCTNLSDIGVSTNMKSSSCKKVVVWKEERSVDGSRTLGAYFRVDSSGCNKWWIIVVSVVVAVVIVGLAIAVVAAVFWNKHKRKAHMKMLARANDAKNASDNNAM